jgi:hypothetical protein
MTRNPTRIESGTRHALAYCSSCPPWRRLTADRPAALLAAAEHVDLTHGDRQLAAKLRDRARAAAADTPDN